MNSILKSILPSTQPKINLVFILLILLIIFDRGFTIFTFGSKFTDIDQVVLWNGAIDYSQFIFHEPYFYGQAYNYMLESLIAVPLIWLNTPVHYALPISTNTIAIFPFIILAYYLLKSNKTFWGLLCLLILLILPLEYNFLTSISRGFVQAHLFIPLLFPALFTPTDSKKIFLFYIGISLSFIANPSSILIVFPMALYVLYFNYTSLHFYLKSFITLPFFALEYLARHYYIVHPESNVFSISGLGFDTSMLSNAISDPHFFEYIFPHGQTNGVLIFYSLLIVILVISVTKKNKVATVFLIGTLFITIISFTIPKVHQVYSIENAGIFYSSSRFYLLLPLVLILGASLCLTPYRNGFNYNLFLIFGVALLAFKNYNIEKTVKEITSETSFPIIETQRLVDYSDSLTNFIHLHQPDLILFKQNPDWDWSNTFYAYSFRPLTIENSSISKTLIAVNLNGDRRTWLYNSIHIPKKVLLVGFEQNATSSSMDIGNQNQIYSNTKLLSIKNLIELMRSANKSK